MRTLAIDIETYSSTDLIKSGVYKYVEAPDFEVMLFAYSYNGSPVMVYDLTLDSDLPKAVADMLIDPEVLKTAHNANFERTCIAKHFGITLPAEQWECTMAKSSMLGLPLSLEAVAKVLHLEQEKDTAGKSLIRYFSLPCKPTKTNGGRTRNLPEHDYDKWEAFCQYCRQDVVVEQAIREYIKFFEIPMAEKKLWYLDQKINDTGVLLDPVFVKEAIRQDFEYKEKLTTEAVKLTGLDNPNSTAQLKEWIGGETGEEVKTLNKETVPALLQNTDCAIVTRVLQLRQEMSKTSVKKYIAMHKAMCSDARLRGIFQFYGANRTGRWAGRIVQPQNLPKAADAKEKNYLGDLGVPRDLVRSGDSELIEMLFGNVPDVLSQLVRTAFVAPKGFRFIISDFSAIEARVIAWLAGEKWRMEVFNTHGKIYEASASQMFKVPLENVTKGSTYRQKGKMAELALGYQGGPDAIIKIEISNKTPAEDRIPQEELPKLVKMWRNANKKIVALWYDVEAKAIEAIETGKTTVLQYGIKFTCAHNILYIVLPSGRKLAYQDPYLKRKTVVFFQFDKGVPPYKKDQKTLLVPSVAEACVKKGYGKIISDPFDKLSLHYWGMDQTTKQWRQQDTYGGKLVENIVQAIARDCLADAMLRIDAAGYKIVMHVHDEVVLEMAEGEGSIEEVNAIMGKPIEWAKGLPLRADSYESDYYKKD